MPVLLRFVQYSDKPSGARKWMCLVYNSFNPAIFITTSSNLSLALGKLLIAKIFISFTYIYRLLAGEKRAAAAARMLPVRSRVWNRRPATGKVNPTSGLIRPTFRSVAPRTRPRPCTLTQVRRSGVFTLNPTWNAFPNLQMSSFRTYRTSAVGERTSSGRDVGGNGWRVWTPAIICPFRAVISSSRQLCPVPPSFQPCPVPCFPCPCWRPNHATASIWASRLYRPSERPGLHTPSFLRKYQAQFSRPGKEKYRFINRILWRMKILK